MNITRRTCLRRLAALGLLPTLAACISGRKLVVASHVWPGYEFLFLARDEGWLPDNELTLLETHTATESIANLHSGAAQAAALTLDEVLLARSQGIPLTVVLVFDVSLGADKVLARPEIKQLADLRGRRIGVEMSAVGSLMLLKMLAAAGLTAQDVDVVEMTGSHSAMWQSGQVEALITYEPTAGQLLRQGAVSLFDSRQIPETIFDVLAVRTDALQTHGSAIRALLAGHFRGVTALRTNHADTVYRLAKHLGLPGNEVMAAYRGLKVPEQDANRSYLQGENNRLLDAARQLSELMYREGRLPRPDALLDLVSSDFLAH